jgi:hypothetical protein
MNEARKAKAETARNSLSKIKQLEEELAKLKMSQSQPTQQGTGLTENDVAMRVQEAIARERHILAEARRQEEDAKRQAQQHVDEQINMVHQATLRNNVKIERPEKKKVEPEMVQPEPVSRLDLPRPVRCLG